MKSFMDWSYQLVSKSLFSARPFNIYDVDRSIDESSNQDANDTVGISQADRSNALPNGNDFRMQSSVSELSFEHDRNKLSDHAEKVEEFYIKFLCFIHRIGLSPDNLVVARVLYRLHLASLIRASKHGQKSLGLAKIKATASHLEASGENNLGLSLKILVLGATGVGKSSTINSIFGQRKAATDAFQPATDVIREIKGTVKGITVSVIDTPGLSPLHGSQRRNRKILLDVRRFTKKYKPDVVLFFERLDVVNRDYNGFSVMKLINDVFTSSIWYNTIIVLTHSASVLPEGPDGYGLSYETFVGHCANVVQHQIHLAVSGMQLEIPFLLVENHPNCQRNSNGEKVLPNGEVWLNQFLLLCVASKVLNEANSLLKFPNMLDSSQTSSRFLSLPHLLSSLLKLRSSPGSHVYDFDMSRFCGDEDDIDQLPPFHSLTKAQFQKLSSAQKNSYLEELEYRETLHMKKLWREELVRQRDSMISEMKGERRNNNDDADDSPPEAFQLPDMDVPLSFDSDSPVYRYRCQVVDNQLLVRPVLDPQGWDRDVGLDGLNVEASVDLKKTLKASIVGQMNKDKLDFHIQSECTLGYNDLNGSTILAGIDVQSSRPGILWTVRGDGALKNMGFNKTGGGLSLSACGRQLYFGAKLEDTVSMGRWFQLRGSCGRLAGHGQAAVGGSLEAELRGKDFPVRDEKQMVGMTILYSDKEVVVGGNVHSDFQVVRGARMTFSANLNSRQMGQICLKTGSSEHAGMSVLALVPFFLVVFLRWLPHSFGGLVEGKR